MRCRWGKVRQGNTRSSPVPLRPIIGPVALWPMDQFEKYIRDCPLSLWSERRGNGAVHRAAGWGHPALRMVNRRFRRRCDKVGGSTFAGASELAIRSIYRMTSRPKCEGFIPATVDRAGGPGAAYRTRTGKASLEGWCVTNYTNAAWVPRHIPLWRRGRWPWPRHGCGCSHSVWRCLAAMVQAGREAPNGRPFLGRRGLEPRFSDSVSSIYLYATRPRVGAGLSRLSPIM